MRLVDADELRNELSNKDYITYTYEYGDAIPVDWVIGAIDNAPTVEPCYQTTSCLDCKMYDKEKHNCPRFCEVIRDLVDEVEERPHGEWIDEGQYAEGHSEHFYRCSECGGHIIELRVDDFCKHCGADMRKEAENDNP